ncbi:MAG: reverse transcriptase/maturase family protein [Spirochaetota bacterium]|nr:reverse transcriptase/maturase family protein [Spirochaetota bacterium]
MSYQNFRLAWLKAIRGKRKKSSVLLFNRDVDSNLEKIKARFQSENPGWGNYRSFTITDPKKRIITAAPFSERIMHHAIMNILEPLFERKFIYHSYACRKGKGTHAAVLQAFHLAKAGGYFLKLDVRKYFDSIDHIVLKSQLSRILKDKKILHQLFLLIDSYHTLPGKGVPIGNLTSQYFANLYLSCLDHYILEQLKPTGYVRYMDDFVLWHADKQVLKTMFASVEVYSKNNLNLELKLPVFGRTVQGLPFLDFLIKKSGIFILRKSKRRMTARVKEIQLDITAGNISEEQAAARANSVNAAVLIARCLSFRGKLWQGSGFGHEPRETRRQLEQQCV